MKDILREKKIEILKAISSGKGSIALLQSLMPKPIVCVTNYEVPDNDRPVPETTFQIGQKKLSLDEFNGIKQNATVFNMTCFLIGPPLLESEEELEDYLNAVN